MDTATRTTQPTNPTRPVKTVKIAALISYTNKVLAESTEDFRQERVGIAHFLETILMDANVYAGFQFIDGENGHRDSTRRRYYHSIKLSEGYRS